MPYSDEDPGDEVVHHDITDAANKPSPTAEEPEEVVMSYTFYSPCITRLPVGDQAIQGVWRSFILCTQLI